MNKLAFAAAAIYAAQLARAQTCTAQQPVPDQSAPYDVVQGEQIFNYMDACPQDNKITFEEFEALVADVGLDTSGDRAKIVRLYQLMDLDNNGSISLEEVLQHYRAKNSPIDLQGSLPPFDAVNDEVFDYMKCRAKPASAADQPCDSVGYTREDLKLALPMLYTLDNIIDDHMSFENYVTHEFLIRDTNFDGVVERWEQEKYDNHYKFIRGFWNYSKGAGNVRETIPDDGVMSYDTWNKQDNMMIKRDYQYSDIPQEAIDRRFNDFDADRNGELTWWEYWSDIQYADLHWYHWNQLYDQISQNDRGTSEYEELTRDEIRDYYTALDVNGTLTAVEIEAQVDGFMNKYSAGQPVVRRWTMWGRYAYDRKYELNRVLAEQRGSDNFDERVWYTNDLNRDKVLTYDELIQNMSHDDAVEMYDLFSKDPVSDDLTYDEVKAILGNRGIYEAMDLPWSALTYQSLWGLPDGEPARPVTIDNMAFDIEQFRQILQVETMDELQTLFDAIDKDGSDDLTQEEVCRHYVMDSTLVCVTHIQDEKIDFIQPDYKPSQ